MTNKSNLRRVQRAATRRIKTLKGNLAQAEGALNMHRERCSYCLSNKPCAWNENMLKYIDSIHRDMAGK